MTFKFKLFKALTGVSLFISGFFVLMVLMSALMGGLAQGLISGILFGGIFIHAILSLYLQRSLQEPSFVLKESTPGGIRIMGGFSIIVGALFFLSGITVYMNRQEFIAELMKQLDGDQQRMAASIMNKFITFLLVFMLTYSFTIIGNAILSLSFLKEWKNKQGDDKDINLDLDA
jgi:hypothetical protein